MPLRTTPSGHDPIAIVGMSGRFPGAPSVDALWQLLQDKGESVARAPADRPWMYERYDPEPRTPGRIPTTRGGFLPGIDRFDAGFFDISPREAARTDPQLRILLETAHETIEDAGIPAERLTRRPAGVFIGCCHSDYWLRHAADPDEIDFYSELGAAARSALSGRLAYAFDLRGPAMSVDAACSSSLLAVHLACQSLRVGECATALAGGANIILTPNSHLSFAWAGGLSPDGSCKFADASANGFVRSEGAGMVLLKPLEQALADGDRVRAVIRGSASGNNGFSGLGMAAPTLDGQRHAIRRAYQDAGVDPAQVAFVEAHGTGTPLGDRIELSALAAEMGGRRVNGPFLVASGKANVGHTEGAAGVTGLIKAVLSLERREVPGNPHLLTPNPAVDWEKAPFRVPREHARLPDGELLAGVNSLGASGTNVHVVLSSASPGLVPLPEAPGPFLLTLSARSEAALRESTDTYRELLLRDEPPTPLSELCAASARQRTHHERRWAVTGDSREELARALDERAREETAERIAGKPRIVYVFPGQGAQWQGMGRELLERSEAFRETLHRCAQIIQQEADWSLLDALRGEDASWQQRTAYVQPALWAMGAALADHWRSWGIAPDAVLGQSQGEIAAAYCAGALTLEQAGRLSCVRARLIEKLAPAGAMAWVALSHTEVPELLDVMGIDAQVAVAESATSAVLSGAPGEIDRLVDACADWGVACRQVPVAYAAHSAQVDEVREPLLEELADIVPAGTTVPFLSTVTSGELPGTELDQDYWWRNLRETVLLEPAVAALGAREPVVFLQMSPHPVLTEAIRSSARGRGTVLHSLRRQEPELRSLLDSLALLYEAGAAPDWDALYPQGGRALKLPPYPWQRERHWHQADSYPYPPIGATPPPAGKCSRARPASIPVLDLDRDRFLLDHRVGGISVMPGAGFVDMLMDSAGPGGGISQVVFHEMLLLDDADPPEVRIRTESMGSGHAVRQLAVESRTGSGWTCHVTARIPQTATSPVSQGGERPKDVRRRCTTHLTHVSGEDFYRCYSGARNSWDGAFRSVVELWYGPQEALARIAAVDADGHRLHPALLDACLQPVATLMHTEPGQSFVLASMDALRMPQGPPVEGELWAHAQVTRSGPDGLSTDITVSDTEGRTVVELTGLRATALSPAAWSAVPEALPGAVDEGWTHALRWETARLPEPAAGVGRYLLLDHGTRLGRRLTRALTASGHTVTSAPVTADLAELFDEAAEDGPLDAVVCLPDNFYDGEASQHVQDEVVRLCASVTKTARAALQAPCRLVVVTRGARQVHDQDSCPSPWQAALWGLGLVIGQEHVGLAVLLADLDEHGEERDDAQCLARLLLSGTPESQVALRGGEFLAPRLADAPASEGSPEPHVLFTRGGLDDLRLVPAERVTPGPGEIEIEVSHAGLNYHDVLAAVGADGNAAEDLPQLGCECAGTVTRTGPDVGGFAVGDPVVAFAHPSLRTHLTVPARFAAPLPDGLSPAEAAALPAAHVTAYYALVEQARLGPGERVLIHSATGGVGLAAIAIAALCGATVYATAGTPAKRELLRRLGAAKVADSRTTDFAKEFSDGVDVVLGTLVGPGMDASFSVLKPFGRYVDLSINDIAAGRALSMRHFAGSRSYLPVNLLDLYEHRPEYLGELVRTVVGLVGDGTLEPPQVRVFPAAEATEAFALMAGSGHIGKIALAMPRKHDEPTRIRAGSSYLVTGGLSGVGGLFAEWLVGQGASHLVLTGRSDLADLPPGDRRVALLERLRESGAHIEYADIDAADEESMAALLRRRDREGLPPVAGAVHAAAVLAPGPATDLTADDLHTTLHPKVAGGWALHRLFADQPLDFFVLFSSAVSVLGGMTVGHHLGSYAAANTFTDALAAHRLASGRPATVVNWGYWSEVGLAARLSEAGGHNVRPQGMGAITPQDAPSLFTRMLRTPGQQLLFPPVDWDRYLDAYPADRHNPLLHGRDTGSGATDQTTASATPYVTSANECATEPNPRAGSDRGAAAGAARTVSSLSRVLRPTRHSATETDARPTSTGHFVPPVAPRPAKEAASQAGQEDNSPSPSQPAPGAERTSTRPTTARPPNPVPVSPEPAAPALGDVLAIEEDLARHLAAVLGTHAAQIDRSRPMNRLGLDSLMATELRTRMRRDHGLDIPLTLLLASESLSGVAARIAEGDQEVRA
ncbi:polyketide synthase [Streptomyces turgidiscabies]|uniref:Acyl transferase domain-containing protein/NADPH:quinone reductase-like Zn-dependent oxidoreductase/acyl carrier protein n=1 Tax=Streptomyces turgidiscabies TaxID=85558 RepID=A0ABU0RUR4_9ACTN|nr:polyketide synthase [Streptomyces turgidiscabies]MDQ0935701.1 acyl transferase domain-containing protein/NADPH:quinone reductase-like Zn-dependent oxidoreductase/acyl carrier protein [Streptomyces turgidiscabies]